MVDRNPYLLIGVDYGSPPERARRAFARAARRVRRAKNSDVTVADLTWALHQIEAADIDPFDDVTLFRVPANVEVFEPGGTGLFAPAPIPLPRRTTTTTQDRAAITAGLAADVGALLSGIAPLLVRFDYGYQETGGAQL